MSRRRRGGLPPGVYKVTRSRGGVAYRGRYVDHAGQRVSRTFEQVADARDFVQLGRAQTKRIRAGLELPPRRSAPTVGDLARRLIRRPPATWGADHRADFQQRVEHHILPTLGERRVDDVRRGDVLDLRDALHAEKPDGKGLAASTTNKILSALSMVIERAVADGHCQTNPCRVRGVRLRVPVREPRTLEASEAAVFLNRVELVYRALVAAALLLGARWGELTAARWGDVDLERRRWLIRRSGARDRPKSQRERVAVMPTALLPYLHELRVELYDGHEPPADYLIFRRADRWRRRRRDSAERHPWCLRACPRTARLTSSGVRAAIADACRAAELDDRPPTFHGLRHTHISLALEAGLPLPAIRDQVGHSGLDMVNRYARGFGQERFEAFELADGGTRLPTAQIVAAVQAGDLERAAELAAQMEK